MCLPFSVALASKVALPKAGRRDGQRAGLRRGSRTRASTPSRSAPRLCSTTRWSAHSNELSTAARVSVVLQDGESCRSWFAGAEGQPDAAVHGGEHEARFTQELSTRVSEKTCAEIVAMSRDLDRLDRSGSARERSALHQIEQLASACVLPRRSAAPCPRTACAGRRSDSTISQPLRPEGGFGVFLFLDVQVTLEGDGFFDETLHRGLEVVRPHRRSGGAGRSAARCRSGC